MENTISTIHELPPVVLFDVIVAHDMLEHINSPIEILTTLKKSSYKHSIIHCTFPNKYSLKAKIQKGTWHMVRPFGHLHYLSSLLVKKMFEESGWKVLELKACRISENSALDLIV